MKNFIFLALSIICLILSVWFYFEKTSKVTEVDHNNVVIFGEKITSGNGEVISLYSSNSIDKYHQGAISTGSKDHIFLSKNTDSLKVGDIVQFDLFEALIKGVEVQIALNVKK